tara:strand:- start:27 stop:281 length:255 start_codon:yes stop_codon:yes gene_type:complete
MPLKIKILKYDNPSIAAKSISKLESLSKVPDEQKLTNARIIRHIANTCMKRSSTPSERENYKKVTSIYSAYILKIEKRIRSKGS